MTSPFFGIYITPCSYNAKAQKICDIKLTNVASGRTHELSSIVFRDKFNEKNSIEVQDFDNRQIYFVDQNQFVKSLKNQLHFSSETIDILIDKNAFKRSLINEFFGNESPKSASEHAPILDETIKINGVHKSKSSIGEKLFSMMQKAQNEYRLYSTYEPRDYLLVSKKMNDYDLNPASSNFPSNAVSFLRELYEVPSDLLLYVELEDEIVQLTRPNHLTNFTTIQIDLYARRMLLSNVVKPLDPIYAKKIQKKVYANNRIKFFLEESDLEPILIEHFKTDDPQEINQKIVEEALRFGLHDFKQFGTDNPVDFLLVSEELHARKLDLHQTQPNAFEYLKKLYNCTNNNELRQKLSACMQSRSIMQRPTVYPIEYCARLHCYNIARNIFENIYQYQEGKVKKYCKSLNPLAVNNLIKFENDFKL